MVTTLQVISVIIGISILVVIHEFGHYLMAKLFGIKVLEFMLGLPGPKIFTYKRRETTFGVTAIPLGGYVKTLGADPYEKISDKDKKRSLEHAPVYKKAIVVLAGPLMNFFFALVLMVFVFSAIGIRQPVNIVGKILKGKPAQEAGIKAGDRIVSINGNNTRAWGDIADEIGKRPNQKINVRIKRKSRLKDIRVRTFSKNGVGKIGVIASNILTVERIPLLQSISHSASLTWFMISKMITVIFNAVTGKPAVFLKTGRSIVGAVAESSQQVTSLYNYFMIVALFNLAIGFFNLLPVPPLDAGKIVIYLFEFIKGRRLKKKLLVAVNAIGLSFLLLILSYFLLKDFRYLLQLIYSKM